MQSHKEIQRYKIPVRKKWHSTDMWRGYYEFDNSVYSTAFLMGDTDGNEKELQTIKTFKKRLKESSISHRIIKTNTSNCCSVGIDVLVPVELKEFALEQLGGVSNE